MFYKDGAILTCSPLTVKHEIMEMIDAKGNTQMKTIAESEMQPMEIFVRHVLDKYLSYTAEQKTYEHWLAMRENKEVREALIVVDMKVAMIQSWFELLNHDEKFVIEQHLIQELEWPRVAFSFSERWKGEFSRAERTLVTYQTTGLKKIIAFAESHRDMVTTLFADIWEEVMSEGR